MLEHQQRETNFDSDLEFNETHHTLRWKERHQSFYEMPLGIKEKIEHFKKIEDHLPIHYMMAVFCFRTYRPKYISPSVKDILGFTQEEYLQLSNENVYPQPKNQRFNYWEEYMKAEKQIWDDKPKGGQNVYNSALFGRPLLNKEGQINYFLTSWNVLTDETGAIPEYMILHHNSIDHLMKNNHTFWFYTHFHGRDTNFKRLFTFGDSKQEFKYLISAREKEIVEYVAKGWSSKKIAEKLFVSSATVDRHRKNVMQRLGLRDSTAMVQVCKMCREIS